MIWVKSPVLQGVGEREREREREKEREGVVQSSGLGYKLCLL